MPGWRRFEAISLFLHRIDGGAPHLRHLRHIGRAALAAFDLDGGDAHLQHLGQQVEGVETGRFLECVIGFVADVEAALAQRRVTGLFVTAVAVEQHAIETRFQPGRRVGPPHRFRRRAHARRVGRFAGAIRRQQTAPFHHHAEAAEAEQLDLDVGVLHHVFHLRQRQHARQHGALDAEVLAVEIHRLVAGSRALHRQMQPEIRVMLDRVTHQPGVGEDHRIHAEFRRAIDRAGPAAPGVGLRIGVERKQHAAAAVVCITQPLRRLRLVEIESRKSARVGVVAKPHVDRIGAVVDGGLE